MKKININLSFNPFFLILLIFLAPVTSTLAHDFGPEDFYDDEFENPDAMFVDSYMESLSFDPEIAARACQKASSNQLAAVNKGNTMRTNFQTDCLKKTGSQKWCSQIERPNPSSKSTFYCTYGNNQPHLLIYPNNAQWKNAFKAIEIIQKLTAKGLCVAEIYNWWRPEPYNKNVGGAAGRHPFGTAVDVRFCSNSEAIRGFDELCKFRARGEIKALGYYGSTGIHIGVADKLANTWGRDCN